MCSNKRWSKNLKESQQKENEFQSVLAFYGDKFESSTSFGEFPDWDISSTASTGVILTYEIKCCNTLDVFIELCKYDESGKVASGLSATKADYYVFSFSTSPNFFLIKTSQLKNLVENKKYKNLLNKNNYLLSVFDKATILSNAEMI